MSALAASNDAGLHEKRAPPVRRRRRRGGTGVLGSLIVGGMEKGCILRVCRLSAGGAKSTFSGDQRPPWTSTHTIDALLRMIG